MMTNPSTPGGWIGRLRLVPGRARHMPGVLAVVAPPAAAASLVPLRAHVTNAALALALALIMVAVVVLVVAPSRRLAALVAGASAGVCLWFDFFLTRPYESFSISRSDDIQTTVLLFVVAVAVGELAARDRHHRTEGTSSSDGLAAVQKVTELVANGAPSGAVLGIARDALVLLLHLEFCDFDPSRAPVTIPYIERPGFVSYSVYRWDTTVQGLPVSNVTLPVRFEGRLLGRFVLQGPLPGVPVELSRLQTAVVLSDLAGLALGRRDRQRPLAPAS